MASVVDGSLTAGALYGLFIGFVLTLAPWPLALARRDPDAARTVDGVATAGSVVGAALLGRRAEPDDAWASCSGRGDARRTTADRTLESSRATASGVVESGRCSSPVRCRRSACWYLELRRAAGVATDGPDGRDDAAPCERCCDVSMTQATSTPDAASALATRRVAAMGSWLHRTAA